VAPKVIAVLLAGFSLAAHGAESAPKKSAPPTQPTQPDIKFLEYLGTVDDDEENWTDALSDVIVAEPPSKTKAKVETPKPVVETK
jgi:hypothetical protein